MLFKQLDEGRRESADLKEKLIELITSEARLSLRKSWSLSRAGRAHRECREIVKEVVKVLRAYKADLPEDILEVIAARKAAGAHRRPEA